MSTSYHMEALRRQHVLERAAAARMRLREALMKEDAEASVQSLHSPPVPPPSSAQSDRTPVPSSKDSARSGTASIVASRIGSRASERPESARDSAAPPSKAASPTDSHRVESVHSVHSAAAPASKAASPTESQRADSIHSVHSTAAAAAVAGGVVSPTGSRASHRTESRRSARSGKEDEAKRGASADAENAKTLSKPDTKEEGDIPKSSRRSSKRSSPVPEEATAETKETVASPTNSRPPSVAQSAHHTPVPQPASQQSNRGEAATEAKQKEDRPPSRHGSRLLSDK